MNERIKKMLASHHVKSNLFLIIVAAVLREMISGLQYYYSRNLLEEELEKQAGTELKLKAMISNSSRYTVESALQSHIREIRRDMASPDSMFSATQWLVRCSRRLAGGGLAFIPYYYPQKGRLFEPYSYWKGDSIETVEITNDGISGYGPRPASKSHRTGQSVHLPGALPLGLQVVGHFVGLY